MRVRGVLALAPAQPRWLLIPEQAQQLDTLARADRDRAGARALRRGGAAGGGRDGVGAPAQCAARRHLARRAHAADRAHRAGRIAADAAAKAPTRGRRPRAIVRAGARSCTRWSTTCSTWRGSKAAARRRGQPAARLAVGGGGGRLGDPRGAARAGRPGGADRAGAGPAAGRVRRGADRARAGQPAGERGQVRRAADRGRRARRPSGAGAARCATTAPGLPAALQGREQTLFDKFTRGQAESATPGVGLGLAICKAMVTRTAARSRPPNAAGRRRRIHGHAAAPRAARSDPNSRP